MSEKDDTIHFSDLKWMASSPAHFLYHSTHPRQPTQAMRLGTLVDMMLLTDRKPVVFGGERRAGREWELFRTAHAHMDIFTRNEYEQATAIAAAVSENDVAVEYLGLGPGIRSRKTQLPLKWETNGVRRSTRGLDVILPGGRIVDLKMTYCTEPSRLSHHARQMFWNVQLADYRDACEQNNIDISGGLYLLCVESKPPYPVTCLRMTDEALDEGKRCIELWIATYKSCLDAGQWPGYVQSVTDIQFSEWSRNTSEEIEEEN